MAWQGTINIGGPRTVIADVTPAFNKDYVVLSLSVSVPTANFTFSKSYNIRGGAVPPEVVNDFKARALSAYTERQATINFLLANGFTEIVAQNP